MIAKKRFIQSGILLAGVALWMRTASLLFNAYVTQKVGAEGMGLLSLTMSVYAFAVTFATSGVSLAVTRQLAAYFGSGEGEKAKRFMTAATLYACVFGSIASVFLYFGAGYIATELLGDLRTASSLRLLSVSLVPIALSSVYSGYFSAVRRVWHNAATQIAEQFFRMSLTVLGLSFLLPKGLEYACLSLVGGSSLSELLSFLILLVQTKRDMRKNPFPEKQIGKKVSLRQEFRTVLANALPCALSAHARSGLLTIEHLLIPKCLKAFGMGRSKALSSYASLHGMAIPVVLFPLAVLTPFTGLFIPEFAELEEKKNKKTIGTLARKAMSSASVFSFGCAFFLLLFGERIGFSLYKIPEAGRYIRLLAPLIPIMYLDSTVDAMLKGLGFQVYAMGVNILDAAVSVLTVFLLLPRFGADGYIYVIYLTEILNFAFSSGKLFSEIHPSGSFLRQVLFPFFAGGVSCLVSLVTVKGIRLENDICRGTVFAATYAAINLFARGEGKTVKRKRQGKTERKKPIGNQKRVFESNLCYDTIDG